MKENFLNVTNPSVESYPKVANITIKQCLKEISILGFPTMFFFLCLFLQQTISLAFIGNKYKGQEKPIIDGIGITNIYINCCLFSISIGLISGMDTLCSNAYAVKNYYLMGLYMHRAQLITLSIVTVITIFNYFYAIKILSLLKLSESVLHYSQRYISASLFYTIIDVPFSVNFRYLNIVNKSHVNLIILFICMALHPLWCWIFIFKFEYDALGYGISLIISSAISSILTSLYIYIWNPCPESYFCLNSDCFKGWWSFLKFTFPTLFLLCAEWWAIEIQAIIAVNISELDYAVHIVMSSLQHILSTVSYGFGMPATILVAKHITERNIYDTKKIALTVFIFGNIVSFMVTSIYAILGSNLVRIFVKEDEEFITKATPIVYILFFQQIFDVSQNIVAYIYRGLGKQLIASLVALINLYLIQSSLSFLFGIVWGYGVQGMWFAILIGSTLSLTAYMILINFLDFNAIRKETLERLNNDKLNIHTKIKNSNTVGDNSF